MIRIGLAIGVACTLVLGADQAVIRSRVDAVLLDVLPIERGRIVSNLRIEDIEIRDNGTLQSVTHLSADRAALGIQLLLDTSGSLSAADLEHLRQGALALAATLGAGDELRLMTFAQIVTLHGAMDAAALGAAFDRLKPFGDTSLHDTLTAGFRLVDRRNSLRPVVIAFSDGADTASWLTARDVEEAARSSWASFFAVTPPHAAAPLLEGLATLTGGEVLKLGADLSTLPRLFVEILERIRQRYLVAFTPTSSTPGWHELDVRIKRSNVRVMARRGYVRR
jgi:VWFA-related protein